MSSYVLVPLDTFFFRGGMPYNAGEDHFIPSQFPPSPRTLQGIVRSKVLYDRCEDAALFGKKDDHCQTCSRQNQCTIEQEIGHGEQLGKEFSIKGPYPVRHQEDTWQVYLPAPLDLVKSTDQRISRLFLRELDDLISDLPLKFFPYWQEADSYHPVGNYLPWSKFKKILWEDSLTGLFENAEDTLWDIEPKPGIARDRATKTAERTKLYYADHIRMKPGTGLWFQVKGLSKPLDVGLPFPAGGEGRLVRLEEVPTPPDLTLPSHTAAQIVEERRFRVVLLQPTCFYTPEGWLPDGFSHHKAGWRGNLGGLEVCLIGAIIGRPQFIGGFDIIHSHPKAMRGYVPAGSVYWFKLIGNESDEEKKKKLIDLHGSCCLADEEERKIGFGHILIGRCFQWNKKMP